MARKGEEEGEGGGEGGTVEAKDRKRSQNRPGLQLEKEPSRRQERTVQRPGIGPMEGGSEKRRAGRELGEIRSLLQAASERLKQAPPQRLKQAPPLTPRDES